MEKPRIRLRGIGPQLEGKIWESTTLLRIGRADEVEIVLSDSSISRYHAEVQASDQGWIARDLGSTNGTFVNGTRVTRVGHRLRHRDVLQCANLALVVSLTEDDSGLSPGAENLKVEATAKHTWEKALEVLGLSSDSKLGLGQPLMALFRTSQHIASIGALEELLHTIINDCQRALDAQRGAVILADEMSGKLELRAVSTGDKDPGGRSPFSTSLAQRCFLRGESVLCRDVNNDPELYRARSIADGAMSSILCVLLRSPRKKIGVLHLDRGPTQPAFTKDDLYLADAIAASVSAGIESAQLLEKQRQLFVHTVTVLAQAIELRDQYTGGHTQRVGEYAQLIAEELSLSQEDRQFIEVGTPLHDIGKIGIDDSILRKPSQLTPEEFEQMKSHTWRGAAILESIPELYSIIPIVRSHHERWDGKGYPDGLAGEQIPLLARIISVADAFDAMTSDRPYRAGLPSEEAFAELQKRAGSQFDPELVEALLRQRPRVEEMLKQTPVIQIEDANPDAGLRKGPPTVQVKRPTPTT